MTTHLDRALALAQEGFRVFPLIPNAKTPALERDWRVIATSDPEKVTRLWTDPVTGWPQPFNIGVALPENVIVVDVDVRDGKRGKEALKAVEMIYDPLPATYRVRTPSRGDHHYFRVDPNAGPFAAHLAENVDLKTAGGFVVGEGSTIDGIAYARVGEAGPEHMVAYPADYVGLSRRAERAAPEHDVSPLVEADDESAIRRAVEWLQTAAPDHGTFRVAARVKDFGVAENTALHLMLEHWRDRLGLDKDDDHVAFRVANAYRYGQNPVGIASPEAEFEPVEIEDRGTKPERPKLYFERWRDSTLPQGETYLIEGWYDLGAMVVSYGESNVGKSNIALNQAVAIATGQPWADSRVRQGLVVYVAAEGSRGFRKRIEAYKRKFGLKDIPFAIVPCPIDLLRPAGDTKALIELVKAAEAEFGQTCVMVVVDTLSRALAGGNENAPDDMGALVMHCDRIRAATGATLHLIHHSGKNQAAGARGHSSLRAATDTEIEIAGDGRGGTITGTKQRDIERSLRVEFQYEVVDLGATPTGARITSIVTHVKRESEFEARLSDGQTAMLEALKGLVRRKAEAPEDAEITPEMVRIQVGSRQWKAALGLRQGDRTADKAFDRDADALLANCDIEVVAVKGRESLWNLALRQTATNPDNRSGQ